MPPIGCPTCVILLRIAPEYSDPSILCPECRGRNVAAVLDKPGALMKKMADDDDDGSFERDDGPRKPAKKRARDDDDDGPKKKGGMSIGIILALVAGVLVVCMCLPMVVAGFLLVPAIAKVREAAARTHSTNNLKNLGLGFHGFHDANKRLPFNGSGQQVNNVNYNLTAVGNNMHSGSWAFQILPYIDQGPAFNAANREVEIKTLLCPGRARPGRETSNGGGAWSDYFINCYVNSFTAKPDAPDAKRTMAGINDGTSNTVFLGHGNISTTDYAKNANVTGSSNIFVGGTIGTCRAGGAAKDALAPNPPGVSLQKDSDKAPAIGTWGGPFSQGALMCMGDATVRSFPYTMQNLSAFLTPTGGEVALPPDL